MASMEPLVRTTIKAIPMTRRIIRARLARMKPSNIMIAAAARWTPTAPNLMYFPPRSILSFR